MNRILLAAVAVLLGVIIAVYLWPEHRDSGTAVDPAAKTADEGGSEVGRAPLARGPGLPPLGDDGGGLAAEEERELTPEQKRAMHRLIKTYQRARSMVADVESSEAIKKQQDGEVERFGTDREGIQAAINSRIVDIQRCYESWLMLNPELAGKIVTGFAIDKPEEEGAEDARVVDVSMRAGGLGNKFLEGCVLSVVSELPFEVPDERIEVNYPFIFKLAPKDGDEE